MKNWISILFLAAVTSTNAQNKISDYKYIKVPEKLNGFDIDQYQLNHRLTYYLGQKNYIILKPNQEWPVEITTNPCAALNVDVNKLKSFTNNKLDITFTNCENKVVETFEGISKIKEYDKGYQEALKLAINKLGNSNPTQFEHTVIPQVVNEDLKTQQKTKAIEVKEAMEYSDGITRITISKLANGDLLLIEGSSILASFKPTLRGNTYLVTAYRTDGQPYTTIGYMTDNSISYEMIHVNNQLQNRIFNKINSSE